VAAVFTTRWKKKAGAARPKRVRRLKSLRLASAAALLSLAACGRMGDLKPAEGHALPVKPLMARSTPTPTELLTAPAYAAPNRVDELMKKSTPRLADPFDLPPPSGQAPTPPVEDNETNNSVGPVTPQ
jgi:hypothetical protein